MRLFLTFLMLMISILSWSQEGFNLIHKAEKKIEKGQFEKAIKLLDKAEKMDYGFCGNAWFEADEAIAVNRVRIYLSKEEPLEAANSLNKVNFWFRTDIDSTKTQYFIDGLGKEVVKREIDSCIELLTQTDIDSLTLPQQLNFSVNFSEEPFHLSYDTVRSTWIETFSNGHLHLDLTSLEQFKIALRNQPFYLLLE